jgi:hypothetical protein
MQIYTFLDEKYKVLHFFKCKNVKNYTFMKEKVLHAVSLGIFCAEVLALLRPQSPCGVMYWAIVGATFLSPRQLSTNPL